MLFVTKSWGLHLHKKIKNAVVHFEDCESSEGLSMFSVDMNQKVIANKLFVHISIFVYVI